MSRSGKDWKDWSRQRKQRRQEKHQPQDIIPIKQKREDLRRRDDGYQMRQAS